jgi:hypothetical protein
MDVQFFFQFRTCYFTCSRYAVNWVKKIEHNKKKIYVIKKIFGIVIKLILASQLRNHMICLFIWSEFKIKSYKNYFDMV